MLWTIRRHKLCGSRVHAGHRAYQEVTRLGGTPPKTGETTFVAPIGPAAVGRSRSAAREQLMAKTPALSRRDFLRAGAVTIAGVSLLTACAPAAPAQPT